MNDNLPEMQMAIDQLYREELYTDRKVGNIRKLIPIDVSGQESEGGQALFMGSTQMMTPAGALPLNFEIEVESLEDAVKQFGDCAKKAMEETIQELEKMRREQASSIVVPGQGSGAGIQIP